MITWLLLRFGIALVDLDLVARTLAAHILNTHEPATLEYSGTLRELRRMYAVTAVETGLPAEAQARVADMAWRYVATAQTQPTTEGAGFSFYT
jgi:hypothetical protein